MRLLFHYLQDMKVLITGATGMIGSLVLKSCLDSEQINEVIIIGRRNIGFTHPKLVEVLHKDFKDYSNLEQHFKGVDIAHFCLGVYTGQVNNDLFKEITVDIPKAFIDMLKNHSPLCSFCFLSGAGADPEEKSRISFARFKGMAENHLLAADFPSTTIFRPGYIYPVEKRKEPNLSYRIFRKMYPLMKLFGQNASIESTQLAEAMFQAGLGKNQTRILENREIINTLA